MGKRGLTILWGWLGGSLINLALLYRRFYNNLLFPDLVQLILPSADLAHEIKP
jgi:hypothetical protein